MFKFTIRELLLLTVIAGLSLGWWVRERQLRIALVNSQDLRARYATSADRWRRMALEFASKMREDGWYVAVESDGSGWNIVSRDSLRRDEADARNNANPLPTKFVLPES